MTSDVWRLIQWANRMQEHGILPLAGGGLDQTQQFLDGTDYYLFLKASNGR